MTLFCVALHLAVSLTAYESSREEKTWLSGNRKGRLCATANEPRMKHTAKVWLSYSARAGVWAPGGRPPPKPTAEQTEALSHFKVGRAKRPIEPLHGVARHPFAIKACSGAPEGVKHAGLFDITYLVIHNDCGRRRRKPRVLLFDMGASVGFNGIPGGIPATVTEGGGIGPSVPLFYRLYQDRCLEPDAIFAWEPNKKIAAAQWWGDTPPEIQHKVRFFEVPVTEGGFLQMLKAVAKASDFVVVKIDIDTPAVEQTIVSVLTERPDLAALVDELFFEYHFYFDGIDFGWGGATSGDVDAALRTMHRLRTLGIRAHFWI